MVLLAIVTSGLYYPAWFLLRRDGLNSLNSNDKLTTFPFVVAILLFAVGIALEVAAGVEGGAEDLSTGADLVTMLAAILLLVQCFKVRHIIEDHLRQESDELSDMPHLLHSHTSLSGVAVFFLQIFYLQYVINRRLVPAREQRAPVGVGTIPTVKE